MCKKKKSKVINIEQHLDGMSGNVDGRDIKKYVYDHIDFKLPESTYLVIDEIFGDLWNNSPAGSGFDFYQMVDALYGLYDHDILLGDHHIHCIAMYVVEALEQFGHLRKVGT